MQHINTELLTCLLWRISLFTDGLATSTGLAATGCAFIVGT